MNYQNFTNFLILEDNPADALICKFIISNNFPKSNITISETLQDALKKLSEENFECVLADLGLQDANGETIVEEILAVSPDTMVVVITGNTDKEIALKTLHYGAGDYLEKRELNPQSLYKSIIYSSERKKSSNELRQSEEKFRSVVTSASDTILTIDLDYKLLFCNKPDSVFKQGSVNQNIFQLIPVSVHQSLKTTFASVVENQQTMQVNLVLDEETDDEQWYSVNIGPFRTRGKMTGFVLISRNITEQKIVEKKIYNLNLQLREFSIHLEKAREDERKHLSREIHDELGQQLTSIKFLFSQLGKLQSGKDEKAAELIGQGNDIIANTIKTVRRIATDLRPGMIDDVGLEAALDFHIREFAGRSGIKCHTIITDLATDYPTYINNTVFRLVQESLNNIFKHADAAEVQILISGRHDHSILIEISDDGIGINLAETKVKGKLGITGMRERVAHLNGEFEITPMEPNGTMVTIKIPIPL